MTESRIDGSEHPVLSIRGAVKHYGPTVALDGATVEVRAGEVVGLVGANGAGKSTLIKLMSGIEKPTSGVIELDGTTVEWPGPEAARASGIETVHQAVDQALVPGFSTAENLVLEEMAAGALGRFPTRRAIRKRAAELAEGNVEADLDAQVETLNPSLRQQVLISRALATRPRFLILDEPTASLSGPERRQLHDSIRRLASTGTGVVYITHHLDELDQVCTRAVVLRDGAVTGEFSAPFRRRGLIMAMLGELVDNGHPHRGERGSAVLLEGRSLTTRPGGLPFDIDVRHGEVLGVTGLIGAGKTELLTQLFGWVPLFSGSLALDGVRFAPGHPVDAIEAGLGFVPEDRAVSGLVPDWSVSWNVTLPAVATGRRKRFLRKGAESATSAAVIDRLGIVCSGPDAAVGSLSGGNQQKVVIARWLARRTRVLLLDEPFRGIDIGARSDINRLLRSGAVESAIVASSDPEEVLEVADRILVMSGGTVTGEVLPQSVEADQLAALMAGEAE